MTLAILASPYLSGGNNVIFEHVSRIHKRGIIKVYLVFEKEHKSDEIMWFSDLEKLNIITLETAKSMEFDIAMATFWKTCYLLPNIKAKSYLYFNQSVESKFYNKSDINTINAADATYLLNLPTITEATWIKDYIYKNYGGVPAELVHNGIRKENYQEKGEKYAPRVLGKLRVLVEGNINSPFKNISKTIEICKQSKADEIWLLTNSRISEYKGVNRVFSNIPTNETAKIYRSCDVLVKLSTVEGMFGPPLEMFHCGGTAITYDVTGHEEYMVHNENSLVATMNDEAKVLEYINELKDNSDLLEKLKSNAITTAQNWPDWEEASMKFEDAILKSFRKPQISQKQLYNKIKILDSWYQYNKLLQEENQNLSRKIGLRIHQRLKKYFN